MKPNLKLSILSALMLLFTLQLSAQGPGGGRGPQMTEEDIKENAAKTAKTLKLNEDQHKKILAVDMDFYNKMQVERQKMRNAGGPPDREEMRAKMMLMRDERNAEYEKVLTADQYKHYLELQEQRRNEMRQRREQNNPEGEEERPARGRGRG